MEGHGEVRCNGGRIRMLRRFATSPVNRRAAVRTLRAATVVLALSAFSGVWGGCAYAQSLYQEHIRPVLEKQCIVCHNSTARQAGLDLSAHAVNAKTGAEAAVEIRSTPLPPHLTPEEEAAHAAFLASLGPNAIWYRFPQN